MIMSTLPILFYRAHIISVKGPPGCLDKFYLPNTKCFYIMNDMIKDKWSRQMVTTLNHGGHVVMYVTVKSVCCTPETNIISYINHTSIKNKNF